MRAGLGRGAVACVAPVALSGAGLPGGPPGTPEEFDAPGAPDVPSWSVQREATAFAAVAFLK